MWKKAQGTIRPLDAPMAGYENKTVYLLHVQSLKAVFIRVSLSIISDAMYLTEEKNTVLKISNITLVMSSG